MAFKRQIDVNFDYGAQAQQLIDDYLISINKGTEKYTVPEGEKERITKLLKENNGLLLESIRIKKI